MVYAVAGVAFSAALSLVVFRSPLSGGAYVGHLFQAAWLLSWPVMLTWGLVTAISWAEWLGGVLLYCLAGAASVWLHAQLFPDDPAKLSVLEAFGVLGAFNWGMTLAVPVFMARRIRAVGVLVLIATLLTSAGALLLSLSVGARAIVWVSAGGAVAGGLMAWPLLAGIATLYRRRLISDQSLLVDSVWFLHGLFAAMFGSNRGLTIIVLAACVPFLVFKVVSRLGFAITGREAGRPRNLLLLRVFALGDRSKELFRAIAMPWRHTGPVRLITGPDLATETIEPHEFLDFMGRKLARHFIDGADTLTNRLRDLESRRDFDGRYRVEELFCHDDTWTMALQALIREEHFVLMDLRGFSTKNKGCVFEVQELLNTVPLNRTLFVIDRTTDETFLRVTFDAVWALLGATSPNRESPEPQVRLFHLTALDRTTVRALAHAIVGNTESLPSAAPTFPPGAATVQT